MAIKSFELYKVYSHRNMLDACFIITKVRYDNTYDIQWSRKDGFSFNKKDTVQIKTYDGWYNLSKYNKL